MKHRWMALPLALGLTLTLALTACSSSDPKEKLVGTWSGQVDVMDQVVEGMRVTAPEIADELELENFYIPLEMEFRDDNTYIMTVDQEKLDESMDALIQKSVDTIMVYMEQMLKEQGITDMTVDEALAQSGMDRESFTQLMRDSLSQLSSSVVQQIQTEGQYRLEGNQMYTSDDKDTEPGSDGATPYTLDGDKLNMDFSNVSLGEVTFTRGG